MNNLTKNEKYAIANILSQIMKADGIIHPKEEEFMDKVYGELELTITDLEDAANIDNIQSQLIINEMSEENRRLAHSLLIGMAESDGFVHPKESAIINMLFNK